MSTHIVAQFLSKTVNRDKALLDLTENKQPLSYWRSLIILPDFREHIKICKQFCTPQNPRLDLDYKIWIERMKVRFVQSYTGPDPCSFAEFFSIFDQPSSATTSAFILRPHDAYAWLKEVANPLHLNWNYEEWLRENQQNKETLIVHAEQIRMSVIRLIELCKKYRTHVDDLVKAAEHDIPFSNTNISATGRISINANRAMFRSRKSTFTDTLTVDLPMLENAAQEVLRVAKEMKKMDSFDAEDFVSWLTTCSNNIEAVLTKLVGTHSVFPDLMNNNHLLLFSCATKEVINDVNSMMKFKKDLTQDIENLKSESAQYKSGLQRTTDSLQSYRAFLQFKAMLPNFVSDFNLMCEHAARSCLRTYVETIHDTP